MAKSSSEACRIVQVQAYPLNVPLREPFRIATGVQSRVENVLVQVRLGDGTIGFGECAPLPAFNQETQKIALNAVLTQAPRLVGSRADRHSLIARKLGEQLGDCPSARAGIETAILDAWGKQKKVPLYSYFGGIGTRIATDISIPIVPVSRAKEWAKRIARFGVRSLKVKVGHDPEQDAKRVIAALSAHAFQSLILDANGGYSVSQALKLLRLLARKKIWPDLFEQPVPKGDLEGLKAVSRISKIPVAADESLASLEDALRLARKGIVQAFNIKIMKCGIWEALEMARIARACDLELMIGGMVESRLAMVCAAHLAAGFGGFRFVDLDMPLLFARDPMRGVKIQRGGIYDLSAVRGGIGVHPKIWLPKATES